MAREKQWLLVYEHNNFVYINTERIWIFYYSNVRRARRDMFIHAALQPRRV